MNVDFNLKETKEIDFNPSVTTIKRRKVNDDYDYEDSMFEEIKEDDEIIDLIPNINNFFVYSGEIKEENDILKKTFNSYKNFTGFNKKNFEKVKLSKIKYSLKGEYMQRNKILMDGNVIDQECVIEYYLNALVSDDLVSAFEHLMTLNIEINFLKDKSFLEKQLKIQRMRTSIEEERLKKIIEKGLANDYFYESLNNYIDLFVKQLFLEAEVKNTKKKAEKTIRKYIANDINRILDEKIDMYNGWAIKLHWYRKNMLFKKSVEKDQALNSN